jgi:hypothetical protein
VNGAVQTLEKPTHTATDTPSEALERLEAAVGLGVDSGATGLTVERVAHVCRERG